MKQHRIAFVVAALSLFAGCAGEDDQVSTYGTSNTGGNTDTGGDDRGLSAEECQSLKSSVTTCYNDYCGGAGATTAFCGCWNQGMDLAFTCECAPLDLQAVCTYFDNAGLDESALNCPGAQQAVGAICQEP